jgi:hypothetical protein
MIEDLRKYIDLLVETRIREADTTDGKAPWGSQEHVSDLEMRIVDLARWRDKQRRGSEARANYSRLISRLKAELASAKRQAQKEVKVTEDISEAAVKIGNEDYDIPDEKIELLRSFISKELGVKKFEPDSYLEGYSDYPETAIEIEHLLKESYPQNASIQILLKKFFSKNYPAEMAAILSDKSERKPTGTIAVPDALLELADTRTSVSAGTQIGRGELVLPLLFSEARLGGSNSPYDVNIMGENWHVKEEKPRVGSKMGSTSEKLITNTPILKQIAKTGSIDVARFSELGMKDFANLLPQMAGALSNTYPAAYGSISVAELYRLISEQAVNASMGEAAGIIWYHNGILTFTPKSDLGVKFFTQGGRIGLSADAEAQVLSHIGGKQIESPRKKKGSNVKK